MRFSLRQLEYFVATGEAGGVTAAAERLHVSQSAMSAAIAQLERSLGVQLFVRRHAQGLALTPAGRRFMREARELLRQSAELERSALALSDEVSGPLEIGCLVTFAPMVTPRLCHEFNRIHPAVSVHVLELGQDRLLDGLRDGGLTLALTYDMQLGDDIEFEPLVALPPHALVAADHPLAAATEVTLERVNAEPLILLDLPISREYFLSLFYTQRLEPSVHHWSPHLEVIRTLVANGFGVTVLNARPRCKRALDGRPLTAVRLAGEHRPVVLGIACLRGGRETRAATAFREHCRASITAADVPGMLAPGKPS